MFVGKGDSEAQTRQTLENLNRVLKEFCVTKSNLAYVELFLTNPTRTFRASHQFVQGIPRKTPTIRQPHRCDLPGVSRAIDGNQS